MFSVSILLEMGKSVALKDLKFLNLTSPLVLYCVALKLEQACVMS